jgi:RHS repeat-associated protein
MKGLLLFAISLAFIGQLSAQTSPNEMKINGKNIEFLSLSQGRYDELHSYNEYEIVGSALIDMKTMKIVRFIGEDSVIDEAFYEMDMTTRFLTKDPLAEKYYQLSPYAYVANNPIKYIDPDGKEIKLAGTPAERQVILNNLQKLTNDKLMISPRTGIVYIQKYNGANGGKTLSEGTRLIRELNVKGENAKNTTIQVTTEGNSAQAASDKAYLKADGSKNVGDNSTVSWNPDKTTGGTDVNGSNQRPVEIGLGHELEHANHQNKGEGDSRSSGKIDPDGSGRVLSKEEVRTRNDENKLRNEQGLVERKMD